MESRNKSSKEKMALSKSKEKLLRCGEETPKGSDTVIMARRRHDPAWVRKRHDVPSSSVLVETALKDKLDPIPKDPQWTDGCHFGGWEVVGTLCFVLRDPTTQSGIQAERIMQLIQRVHEVAAGGYRVDVLADLCEVLERLVLHPGLSPRAALRLLLAPMAQPVLLTKSSDVCTHFHTLTQYMALIGYLLIQLEEDELFDLVSLAVLSLLGARPPALWCGAGAGEGRGRGGGALHARPSVLIAAAAPVLVQTIVRMIALSSIHRFPTFQQCALIFACASEDYCMMLMEENIIENLLYRFNPYFPARELPEFDTYPLDPQANNIKLGDSTVHIRSVLSLMLVLLQATKRRLAEQPALRQTLPCPDNYAQRCFLWAFRVECVSRARAHERCTLAVLAAALLHCFHQRLSTFSQRFTADVLSLSVSTEVRPTEGWIKEVNFDLSQQDVNFKKKLMALAVTLLRTFPYNRILVEPCHWLVGVMYLVDPGLCALRSRWPPALFAELRMVALQALVCTLPVISTDTVLKCGIIRRLMWYIEWYTESPFEISVLYWCLRALQTATFSCGTRARAQAIQEMFDTHGINIFMNLCSVLAASGVAGPVERVQAALAVCARVLAGAAHAQRRVSCCVYPHARWPQAVPALTDYLLQAVLYSLKKNIRVTDRWLISLLYFIWEAVIWKEELRDQFVINNGIYKLLDLTTMCSPEAQCMCLALTCDAARSGVGVAQLVSWRASISAENGKPVVVKRGATVVSLLAGVCRDECARAGVRLDSRGVIQDLEGPLLSRTAREWVGAPEPWQAGCERTARCYAAADLAGSRISKASALLQLLSRELRAPAQLADSAYNLYQHVKLPIPDEVMVVLLMNFLALKQGEAWREARAHTTLLAEDEDLQRECEDLAISWSREVQRQQEEVINQEKKAEAGEEASLYDVLLRAQLHAALRAHARARGAARAASRGTLAQVRLQQAVAAHLRRYHTPAALQPIIKTYVAPLDDENMTGQNLKVNSTRRQTVERHDTLPDIHTPP